jgi:hypothetical protein
VVYDAIMDAVKPSFLCPHPEASVAVEQDCLSSDRGTIKAGK